MLRTRIWLAAGLAAWVAGGCALNGEQPVPPSGVSASQATGQPPARPTRRRGDERPESYVVQRGDTLYAIALDFGFDYRDLATWNDLRDPSRILVGQRLRFTPPPETRALPAAPTITGEPLSSGEASSAPSAVPTLAEPRAQTLPYSDQALVQMNKAAGGGATPVPAGKAVAAEDPRAATRPTPPPKEAAEDDESLDWVWPVRGDLLYRFGDSGRLKGVGIAGKMGQPVAAAAGGRVVYSGSGLRGYGRLVIVKHNETYLSVYAHNSALSVKEGDAVKRGQKIAEMGDSDAARVGLHFEIRRFGRPIDPLTRLPGG